MLQEVFFGIKLSLSHHFLSYHVQNYRDDFDFIFDIESNWAIDYVKKHIISHEGLVKSNLQTFSLRLVFKMFLDFQSFPPKSHKFSSFNLMKIQLTLIIRSNRLTCGVDYIFKQNFNLRTTKQFLKHQNVYIFGRETSNINFSDSIPSKCLPCSWHMYHKLLTSNFVLHVKGLMVVSNTCDLPIAY